MNLRNPKEYCENLLWIRTKKQTMAHLRFNDAQENLYGVIRQQAAQGKPIRLIVLKGRQEGISTVTEGLMFQDTVTRPNVKTLIVAHENTATANLFKMNKLFYDSLPPGAQPMRKNSNAKELVFENPTKDEKEKRRRPGLRSSIRCQTAGKGGVGRSDTLTNVHISEYAFWPKNKDELLLGIMQAVPDEPDTMVVIESTANGYDHFKTLWDDAVAGANAWTPVFLPWYLEPGYRKSVPAGTVWSDEEEKLRQDFGLDDEQLMWRRWCIKANCGNDAAMFRQEYPNTPVLLPCEDIGQGGFVPLAAVILVECLIFTGSPPAVFHVESGGRDLLLCQIYGDLVAVLPTDKQAENQTDNLGGFLVDYPKILVVWVFDIAVRGFGDNRLSTHALGFNARFYFLADVLCIPLRHDIDKGRKLQCVGLLAVNAVVDRDKAHIVPSEYLHRVADLEIVTPPAGKVFHNADTDFPVFHIVHHAGVGGTVKKSAAFVIVDVVPDIG